MQEILILKTPPRKMRMQIVEEQKQANFAARGEQTRRLSLAGTRPVTHDTISMSVPELPKETLSPTAETPLSTEFGRRFRTESVYSDDSRRSNVSPVARKSKNVKAFNFGSQAVHSDEEEEVVESALYRTICAKKLADAELPIPEKRPTRRLSQYNNHSASPSSPLSPQLKSYNRRASLTTAPSMPPAPLDGFRAATSETLLTEAFQPSPMPGMLRRSQADAPVRTNSDSFMALPERFAVTDSQGAASANSANAQGGLIDVCERLKAIEIATESKPNKEPSKTGYDWLRNYKCSMRKCVSPITEGWKRPDGGSVQSGRMMAIFDTGFYVVGKIAAVSKCNLSLVLTTLKVITKRCP